jgi:hypothetical protein
MDLQKSEGLPGPLRLAPNQWQLVPEPSDILVIGAGAAGLFAAA